MTRGFLIVPPSVSNPRLQSGRASAFDSLDRLFDRQSHAFSPSLSHRLGAQVSLQGASRRGPHENARHHPAGLRRAGRDHFQRDCRGIISTCSSKSRPTSGSAISCARPRGARRAKSSRSSSTFASATGGNASGTGATSQPLPATSPMTSSCVTWTAIPTRMASAPPHDPTGLGR